MIIRQKKIRIVVFCNNIFYYFLNILGDFKVLANKVDKNAKELHTALGKLIRVYQFRDRDKIQVCCRGLSVTQYYVIAMLVENGSLGIMDLTKILYL